MRGVGPANLSFANFETSGRMPVDPLLIEAVEISRGPNSTVFGLGNAFNKKANASGVTLAFWRSWLDRCTYTGRWREMLQRSAITLKLMTYAPSGGLVAAPTAGLHFTPDLIETLENGTKSARTLKQKDDEFGDLLTGDKSRHVDDVGIQIAVRA